MISVMTCSTCRFAVARQELDGEHQWGECRRHAPVASLMAIDMKTKGKGWRRAEDHRAANWPVIGGEDWCGEYRMGRGSVR